MDLRQMQVVVAVAEEGGFSAAARRLHVVQSAVSGTVRTLERELGASLFRRTTHAVALTAAGQAFLPAARAAIQAAEQARVAVELVKGELRGVLTVGIMQGMYPGFPAALRDFRREHPAVVIRLRQMPADEIRQSLRDGVVDIAITALDRAYLRGLATRVLVEEQMVVVSAPHGALSHDAGVRLSAIAGLPLVDFSPGWAVRRSVDRAFRAAHLERAVTVEVNDLLAAADLVRMGLGVCIMPASLAARFPDLAVFRFADRAPTWRVMAVCPSGAAQPAAAALLQHLR